MKKSFFIVLLFIVQINCVPNDSIIKEIVKLLREEVLFLSDCEISDTINKFENLEERLQFFYEHLNELKKLSSLAESDFLKILQSTEKFLSDIILCIPDILNKYLILMQFQEILKYKQQNSYEDSSYFCGLLISSLSKIKNPICDQKNLDGNIKEKEILKKLTDKVFEKLEEQKVKILESPITIFAEYEGLPTESKDILDFFSVKKINKIQLLRYYKLAQLTKDYVSFYQQILFKLLN